MRYIRACLCPAWRLAWLVGTLLAALRAATPCCRGAVLDWSSVTWADGDNNGNSPYSVGPYQVTVTVTYYGGSNVDSSDGSLLYPRIQSWTSLSDSALGIWMDCATDNGSSNYVIIDITLNQAVAGVFFTLADIDTGSDSRDYRSGRYDDWQDVVVVSAFQGTTRRTVTGTALNGSPSFGTDTNGNDYSTSGSGDLCLYGTDGNIDGSDSSGDVLVRIADPVDHIQIRYAPGGTGSDEDGLPYAGPDNPDGQRILLGDIVVPEPSTALLLVLSCGLFATRRQRRQVGNAATARGYSAGSRRTATPGARSASAPAG